MARDIAVCLMGPTASGKTDLALELAASHPFEIVSVDSAMVYRGMDIGTAKPDLATRERIAHHLIDIRDPAEPYSAAMFRRDAIEIVRDITARGRIPLLVGGTMLYFKALKEGLAELPAADANVRADIQALADTQGWAAVHARLEAVDPEAARRIHPGDPQRLQRALEVYEITGQSMTALHAAGSAPCPFDLYEFSILPTDRARLHDAIAVRFGDMLDAGLVEEVRQLAERGDLGAELPAIKAVGYRQVWEFLQGESTYEEMVARGIVATRQLAKRQFTWLRGWQDHTVLLQPEAGFVLKKLGTASIL